MNDENSRRWFMLGWCLCMVFVWLNCVHLMDTPILVSNYPLVVHNYSFFEVGVLPGLALVGFSVFLWFCMGGGLNIKKLIHKEGDYVR